ncbi:MAG: hypothetical protein AABY32_02620 [Nanoarchaeota archaeon]
MDQKDFLHLQLNATNKIIESATKLKDDFFGVIRKLKLKMN